MLAVSLFLFSTYGASLFLGTPLLMGSSAAYIYNRPHSRSYRSSVGVGLASVFFAGVALLLFALEGLSQLLQTVERVQQGINPDLNIIGVTLTMFDRRNRLTDQVAEDVRECLGGLVFDTVIPRNVRLSEAPSHGLPALIYDHSCAGSRAYMSLARELLGRLPAERKAA